MTPKGNKGENYIIKAVAFRPQRGADQDKFKYIVYKSWEGCEGERDNILMTSTEENATEEHPTFIMKASLIFSSLFSSF